MANDYNNVSVRLNKTDYQQLEYLHKKFNRNSYTKVSLADVLRVAVKELYLIESKDDSKPVLVPNREEVLEQLETVQNAEKETATASEPKQAEPTPKPANKPATTKKTASKPNTAK